jgi:hypothetical protein
MRFALAGDAHTQGVNGVTHEHVRDRFLVFGSHPRRLSVKQLIRLAPEYLHRTPNDMLIFFQRPGR